LFRQLLEKQSFPEFSEIFVWQIELLRRSLRGGDRVQEAARLARASFS
jgi:hypothetical protein